MEVQENKDNGMIERTHQGLVPGPPIPCLILLKDRETTATGGDAPDTADGDVAPQLEQLTI